MDEEERPFQSLADFAKQFAEQHGIEIITDPLAHITVQGLIACESTEFIEAKICMFQGLLEGAQEGTSAHQQTAQDLTRWERRLVVARQRDAAFLARRALGPEYEGCICLGLGGTGDANGDEIAAMMRMGDKVLPVLIDGKNVWTWRQICSCPDGQAHKVEVEAKRVQAAEQVHANRVARIFRDSGIPELYEHKTSESWERAAVARGAAPRAVEQVLERINDWKQQCVTGTARLLLLIGNRGVGKSGLACALAQDWVERERPVRFTTVTNLARELRAAPMFLSAASTGDDGEKILTRGELEDAYLKVPLLVLDDLGTEVMLGGSGDILLETVFSLMDERMYRLRPTIVTTNLPWPVLTERYGSRLTDRLDSDELAIRTVVDVPNLRSNA